MNRTLLLDDAIWRSLTISARQALPREVGGILLGYYTVEGPRVVAAPVVPDPRATRIRYRRDAEAAGRILAACQQDDSTNLLGYLGEWHTHPLPIGPSSADLLSVRRLAEDGGHDVALVVLALRLLRWEIHVRNATPAGTVQTVPVSVEGGQHE